jgi:hypothetical protein
MLDRSSPWRSTRPGTSTARCTTEPSFVGVHRRTARVGLRVLGTVQCARDSSCQARDGEVLEPLSAAREISVRNADNEHYDITGWWVRLRFLGALLPACFPSGSPAADRRLAVPFIAPPAALSRATARFRQVRTPRPARIAVAHPRTRAGPAGRASRGRAASPRPLSSLPRHGSASRASWTHSCARSRVVCVTSSPQAPMRHPTSTVHEELDPIGGPDRPRAPVAGRRRTARVSWSPWLLTRAVGTPGPCGRHAGGSGLEPTPGASPRP